MLPNSQNMNTLNNTHSRLHKVAFFGVEDSPEVWRVMHNVIVKDPSEYELFEANEDDSIITLMEEARFEHIAKIRKAERDVWKLENESWFNRLIRLRFNTSSQIKDKEKEIEVREQRVDFLNNANTYWRYLIGSYHPDSVEWIESTQYLVRANTSHSRRNEVLLIRTSNESVAQEVYQNALNSGDFNSVILTTKEIANKRLMFFPSDGVVLAKSQMAFPGVEEHNISIMPGSNHFQMRNDANTERALHLLYDGSFGALFRIK